MRLDAWSGTVGAAWRPQPRAETTVEEAGAAAPASSRLPHTIHPTATTRRASLLLEPPCCVAQPDRQADHVPVQIDAASFLVDWACEELPLLGVV
jgi:hypothetical protein